MIYRFELVTISIIIHLNQYHTRYCIKYFNITSYKLIYDIVRGGSILFFFFWEKSSKIQELNYKVINPTWLFL